MRVLVVSEQASERLRATSALLLRADTEVVEAETAAQARELLAGEPFDVLVIDGDLSPRGGFSLLYELRAQGELAGTDTPPALVMVAREDDRWLAAWAGANEAVRKPVDPFRLAASVAALVGEPAAQPVPTPESASSVRAALDRDPAPP